ncbi:deleted in malignant brain tumors 1 protein-like [Stegastes partitus]|uniref:Deleted in malignant brain tumors 1 protein-like n=1 Tax=Stegastes partitus TaxID=144197 RepID=A0A3B4Z3L3_9TELE|nr:PREDICTED: deleted in malignant brain tumors 1 protein-like [Stegastes partitus]
MEAGAVLLLLLLSLGVASTATFYGDSLSFMPPQRNNDGTYKVTFYHRQNSKGSCKNESTFTCGDGVCTNFDKSSVLPTDQENAAQPRWCQSEGRTTATVSTTKTSLSLSRSGCCWESNVAGDTVGWTSGAELDLGTRSDTQSINSCPVTTTVSSLRVPQNCLSKIRLLAYDPDGDKVKCSYASNATQAPGITLDEAACTLTRTGNVTTGVHLFALMLEDVTTKNVTVTYADKTTAYRDTSNTGLPPLCKVKLQFSLEILEPIPNCELGHVQPMFLSRTPSHGAVLHATVGQTFQLYAQAQADHSSILDFQVSGPHNMTKNFKDGELGKAEVTMSWTPQQSDLYRFVPVCFTAEAKDTQSEMRCVVVMVTQASITQGKATVQCAPNKMTVALEKASMPGIDENFLQLRDSTCSLTSNNTHIMGVMSFTTCGTKLEDKGDFIVFMNEINSFVLPNEVIVRRQTVKIDFSCQFPKTVSISSYYNLHKSDYIFTESSFGSFGYTFEIFRDGNFTSKVDASAYPVEVKLLDTIYMGIEANSELPNVTLFVESCKATPDDNPDNPISYDLIKNGCLQDETLKVYSSPQTEFKFHVQAFKFTGNYDQVYVTCSVILCEPESPFSRCAQGCVKDPSRRRRRRGLSKETVGHYITQGPLQFVRQEVPSAAEDEPNVVMPKNDVPAAVNSAPAAPDVKSGRGRFEFKAMLSSNVTTVVFASAFLVSLVLLAVVVHRYSRKRREEDSKALIVPDLEN